MMVFNGNILLLTVFVCLLFIIKALSVESDIQAYYSLVLVQVVTGRNDYRTMRIIHRPATTTELPLPTTQQQQQEHP
jgi:hypothetical protein